MKAIRWLHSLLLAAFLTSPLLGQSDPHASAIYGPSTVPARQWKLSDITWDKTFADGTKLAILEGPRDVPGKPFTYAFYMPDGVWVKPHWHCADARVFVAKGTLLLGLTAQFDKDQVVEMNAGDYFLAPYRIPHYEGSRGETIIIGTGTGPWCTVELE